MENTDEINRYIHVEIMGKDCPHKWLNEEIREKWWAETTRGNCPTVRELENKCVWCGLAHIDYSSGWPHENTKFDYCSDSSARSLLREVEKIVIAKVGIETYVRTLIPNKQVLSNVPTWEAILCSPTINRATACVEAHKAAQSRGD